MQIEEPPVYIPENLRVRAAAETGMGSILADIKMYTRSLENAAPTTARFTGEVMGQPVDETRTGVLDQQERSLMLGVTQAFGGADYLNRSRELTDGALPTPELGVMQLVFADAAGQDRIFSLNVAEPAAIEPADMAFLQALETYSEYALPEEATLQTA